MIQNGADYFFVMYNMHWENHEFGLPRLPKDRRWHVVIDTSLGGVNGHYETGQEPCLEDQKTYMVKERSIAVLTGKKYEVSKKKNKEAARDEKI